MSERGEFVLAVDGGNSKTDVALVREDGTVLAALRGPGSSPHHLGLAGALDVIGGLIDEARRRSGLVAVNGTGARASAAAWFMAGADLPNEEKALAKAVTARGWSERAQVANDTFAILRAGSTAGWGVAVVVGAGVNCVGRSATGATARYLALGAVTGDWGGGLDIGYAALGAAVRAEDGRGPATSLTPMVARHFGRRRASDVSIAIHQRRLDHSVLADLPPVVVAAADGGDAAAIAILRRQATEVVALATGAIRRLRLTSEKVDVVLGGSVLTGGGPHLLRPIRAGITEVVPGARVVVCRVRPIVGAALAALELAGAPPEAERRLRRSLRERTIQEVSP
jgi:N-acetylglucosamine kinase-like BadF-type ATPase